MAACCGLRRLRRDAVSESRNDERRQIAGAYSTRSVGPQLVRRAGRTDDAHELDILVPPEKNDTARSGPHYEMVTFFCVQRNDRVQRRAILDEANGSFDST